MDDESTHSATRMNYNVNWPSVPGIAVSGVLAFYATYVLSSPVRRSSGSFQYFFRQESLGAHLWSPLFLLLSAVCIVYGVTADHSFSRRTVGAVVGVVTLSQLRYAPDQSGELVFLTLGGLVFSSVLISEATDSSGESIFNYSYQFDSIGVFGTAALTAYTLLLVGLVVTVLSVLFVETNPLVVRVSDSTPGIAFLTGGERAYDEARIPFWGVAITVVFVAVVTDAVRHRAVRSLTVIALVVNIGALAVLWYPTIWTATVAAVGALLAVITLALVLNERTEATLS